MSRPRGTGVIEPRPGTDGIRYRARFPDRGRYITVGTYATEEAAARALNAMVKAASIATAPGGVTVAEFADGWFAKRELGGDGANIRSERSSWRHVAAHPIATMPLDSTLPGHVRDFALSLPGRKKTRVLRRAGKTERIELDQHISHQTAKHVLTTLRKCLGAAIDDGHIERNPAKGIQVPKPKKKPKQEPWTYLTAEEVALVETTTAIPLLVRETFVVAIYTGLRQRELWGLHWRDVHLDAPQPYLRVRFSGEGAPKNGKERAVPLLPRAVVAFRRLQELCPDNEYGLVWISRRTGKMFGRHDMSWADISDSAVEGGIRRGRKFKIGIERQVRFHDLRHTCASHLLMGTWGRRWDLMEVRDFLGHSEIGITQRYAHLAESALMKAAAETLPKSFPNGAKAAESGPVLQLRSPTLYPAELRAHDSTDCVLRARDTTRRGGTASTTSGASRTARGGGAQRRRPREGGAPSGFATWGGRVA